MQTSTAITIPTPGSPMLGGFFVERFRVGEQVFALIAAPKIEGDHDDIIWIGGNKDVPGAKSYDDGMANTLAMAEAGSKIAKWALDLRIGDYDDWYLPSQDELQIMYRWLKPTTEENWCYARSGINLSAIDPTRPYTPKYPVQTPVALFQAGGEQAFDPIWYWSSTQHAAYSDCAWCQGFDGGSQGGSYKSAKLRARAVRRVAI